MAGNTQTKEIKMIGKDLLLVLVIPLLLVLVYSFSARVYLSSIDEAGVEDLNTSSVAQAEF